MRPPKSSTIALNNLGPTQQQPRPRYSPLTCDFSQRVLNIMNLLLNHCGFKNLIPLRYHRLEAQRFNLGKDSELNSFEYCCPTSWHISCERCMMDIVPSVTDIRAPHRSAAIQSSIHVSQFPRTLGLTIRLS